MIRLVWLGSCCKVEGVNREIKSVALDRFYVAGLGEYYSDALKIEAWLKNRSIQAEAGSLLTDKLIQREAQRMKILEDLARKRKISAEELIDQILCDRAEGMSPEDYKEFLATMENEPNPVAET